MQQQALDLFLNTVVYAALVGLVFAPLEKIAPLRDPKRRAFALDVWFATAGAAIARLAIFALGGLVLAIVKALAYVGPLADVPAYVSLPIGLVCFELAGYAYHRAAHASPWLFRLHAVHHSSTEMDWLAGFRQHPLEIALMTLVQNLPLVLLGLPVGSHFVVALLLRLNTSFVHSNVQTPAWLASLLATPTFHHRHHDRDAPNANYATLLPWIDRLFGTWSSERAERFGLAGDDGAESSFWRMLLIRPRRLAEPNDSTAARATDNSPV